MAVAGLRPHRPFVADTAVLETGRLTGEALSATTGGKLPVRCPLWRGRNGRSILDEAARRPKWKAPANETEALLAGAFFVDGGCRQRQARTSKTTHGMRDKAHVGQTS